MGNGPESSGDGWKHRGGGAIQLTGRKNIGAFAFAKNITIEQATDYIRTPAGALDSAGWFWKVNNLSKYGDQGLFQAVQGLVNVGRANATIAQINHWNDRLQRYNRAKKALGV
jgi:putative chitinase